MTESDIWSEDEAVRDVVVRGFLAGELHWTFNSRTDTHQNGADWLSTQHNYAATPEAAVRLSNSVVKCLDDSSKVVRAAAVEFFGCCSADDGGALVSAVLNKRSLYRRTPYPYTEKCDNAFAALICIVAARENTYSNEEAIQVLREEIDRDPKNLALIAAMAGPGLDREWMLDQAPRLVTARPELVKWYLGSSTRRPDRLEFLNAIRDVLAPEVLRAEIQNAIPNAEKASFYLRELGL